MYLLTFWRNFRCHLKVLQRVVEIFQFLYDTQTGSLKTIAFRVRIGFPAAERFLENPASNWSPRNENSTRSFPKEHTCSCLLPGLLQPTSRTPVSTDAPDLCACQTNSCRKLQNLPGKVPLVTKKSSPAPQTTTECHSICT